jgi:multisubunit Na+/H+ antiporter MnhB subunit
MNEQASAAAVAERPDRLLRGHLPVVKVAIAAVVGAFVLFYIITSPNHAADIAESTWHVTVNIAHGIGHFFDKLSS